MRDAVSSDDAQAEMALLAAYAGGDSAAARQLTLQIAPRVFAMATRMLGDRAEAEDVTQDAMLKLWRIARDWQDTGAKPSSWVFQVAANMCRDILRARGRRPVVQSDPDHDPADDSPGGEERLQSNARAEALRAALATLPDRQRMAIVLRHMEGQSNPEIAEVLGVSVEAVESLTARGKRSLAAALANQKEALGLLHGT